MFRLWDNNIQIQSINFMFRLWDNNIQIQSVNFMFRLSDNNIQIQSVNFMFRLWDINIQIQSVNFMFRLWDNNMQIQSINFMFRLWDNSIQIQSHFSKVLKSHKHLWHSVGHYGWCNVVKMIYEFDKNAGIVGTIYDPCSWKVHGVEKNYKLSLMVQ